MKLKFLCLILLVLILPTLVGASVAELEREPLIFNGVEYSAGILGVEARDVKTKQQLWVKELYRVKDYGITDESATDSSYLRSLPQTMEIVNDKLVVVYENNNRFELDPKTGQILEGPFLNIFSQFFSRISPIWTGLTIIIIIGLFVMIRRKLLKHKMRI